MPIITLNPRQRFVMLRGDWLLADQSVEAPYRNSWETDELFENHSCMIVGDEEELEKLTEGKVEIAFQL